MTEINSVGTEGGPLTCDQRRLCLENISRLTNPERIEAARRWCEKRDAKLIGRRPKQRDYKPAPLSAPMGALAGARVMRIL